MFLTGLLHDQHSTDVYISLNNSVMVNSVIYLGWFSGLSSENSLILNASADPSALLAGCRS